MDSENALAVLASVIGAGGLTKLASKWIDSRDKKKILSSIEDFALVYDAINDIIENTEAKRVLVFQTHNSGQEIKPTSKIFATCLFERIEPPFRSVKHQYQGIPLDAPYINMLLSVVKDGKILEVTKDMEDGLLKTYYESEGVTFSEVHFLHDKKSRKIWYMSVASDSPFDRFSKLSENHIKRNVSRIAKIIKKYE